MRSTQGRFIEESCRLLGAAVLLAAVGGGLAIAEGDRPSPPLQGPIPFEAFDLDGSGGISPQEFDEVHARRDQEREKAGLSPFRPGRSFSSIDADGNGAIDRAELEAVHGARGGGQGRGPGGGKGPGPGGGPPAFSEFDLDGDGAITEKEFIDARTKRIAERVREGRMMSGLPTAPGFSDLDADGSGSVTPEEFAVGMRSHGQGMGRGGPPAEAP
jgi:Ca2+-binding EF-hand superfamily protein